MNHTSKKIHIIGSVGSGKTTLARKLFKKLHIPYYELDNVVWKRDPNGDIRFTDEERDALTSVIFTENLNGVYEKAVNSLYNKRICQILEENSRFSLFKKSFCEFR